jgi:hypothetical protein
VAVVSLVSNWIDVAPDPVIWKPKFVAGVASQDATCVVTSTRRNAFATLAAVEPNGGAAVGPGKMTEFSAHGEVTTATFRVPGVITLLT